MSRFVICTSLLVLTRCVFCSYVRRWPRRSRRKVKAASVVRRRSRTATKRTIQACRVCRRGGAASTSCWCKNTYIASISECQEECHSGSDPFIREHLPPAHMSGMPVPTRTQRTSLRTILTPPSISVRLGASEGSSTNITKLVEWPVVESVPARVSTCAADRCV